MTREELIRLTSLVVPALAPGARAKRPIGKKELKLKVSG